MTGNETRGLMVTEAEPLIYSRTSFLPFIFSCAPIYLRKGEKVKFWFAKIVDLYYDSSC